MADNKNLPAYPNLDSYENGAPCTPQHGMGLSKRELISAMCLQSMLVNPAISQNTFEYLSKEAVEAADALLTHLENTQK